MRLPGFSLRSSLLGAGCAALIGAPALSTWSIVVVDRATGEVAAAGATCIEDFPLRNRIAVISVGNGAACAQASVDGSGENRGIIFDGLRAGLSPDEILANLAAADSLHNRRQYGIVSLEDGPPVTFTGGGAGLARIGVVGEQGSILYAIQGNVLAGDAVVTAAEQTLLNTPGDLGQRIMAAMETARATGGDGRCSCSYGAPTNCGAPPPGMFKSAHTAFIVVSRIGDIEGGCAGTGGCASGGYYLSRRFNGSAGDIDPVIELQSRYDDWRNQRIGDVDHLLTEVVPSARRIPADGETTVEVTVRLRDIEGTPLTSGGQILYVRGIGGPQPASLEGVVDNGDGTHTIQLRATDTPGKGRWRIVVDNGLPRVRTLHPPLEIDIDPLTSLHAGFDEVSASAGAEVPVVINAGADKAGRIYQMLASASGTSPGSVFDGVVIPLNADRLLRFTADHPGPPLFPDSVGGLDDAGRAQATLRMMPRHLTPFIGGRIDLLGFIFGHPTDDFTVNAGFDVLP